jgi:23S rRNA (uracil1939-C5)-methyltransferase
MTDPVEVEIERLGAQGDGVAGSADEPRYVPFALPGERWRLGAAGSSAAVALTTSPERAAPICRHFGTCGGCVAQHMSDRLYAGWKHGLVAEAFRHRAVPADVRPLVRVAIRSRRRAFLGVERRGREVAIGFREEGRHTLVDMEECPVLDPSIVTALPSLREMARIAMPPDTPGRLIVTRLDAGLDVAFDNGLKLLSPETRCKLAAFAERAGLVRLSVAGDMVVQRGAPELTLGGVAVEPPPAIFLQAVPEAERALIDLVLAGLPKRAKRVADLFSGLGTFALPLARRVQVTAYDSDKRAIAALGAATRKATGLKPVTATVRDLFREPLSARELDQFDAVVLDPPRAGAAAQSERLAKSKVPVVIAVSCAPATLARDARTLIEGGYAMGPVTPIDQFLFTPHVEAVAVFSR